MEGVTDLLQGDVQARHLPSDSQSLSQPDTSAELFGERTRGSAKQLANKVEQATAGKTEGETVAHGGPNGRGSSCAQRRYLGL